MGQIYEGMILLDNNVVRADWRKAKAIVTDTLTKYEATIHTARRWDERALAYPIKGNQRATYFLTYFELPNGHSDELRRALDLNASVLRYLFLAVDEIPEEESDLASAEDDSAHTVDAPPADGPRPTAFDEIDEARESERQRVRDEEDAAKAAAAEREAESAEKSDSDSEAKPDSEADSAPESEPKPEEAAATTTATSDGDSPQES
ncbi:MAG: 30S ribosomal protein S6 [Planctomycetota bacterium]|nr:30S ribosomal protein S6 [Planctomycetota bacterium]